MQKRIAEHKQEVAKLREIYPDPLEALFQFTRENFDEFSLLPDGHRVSTRRKQRTRASEDDELDGG
jgi:hypothetical protein